LGNLFGSVDVQLQYLFQPDISDFSALCHFWTACQAASIQSWKLGEEASWRLSDSGKVSTLQATRQVAWQNVANQQQMNFKIYEYQSASHEFELEQWVLLKDN
jgi:hypothetical protein